MEKPIIIFDFDGVIVDSFHVAFEVAKLAYPTLLVQSYREKWNANISKAVFTEPLAKKPVDFQKEYSIRMKKLKLDPRIKEALKSIYDRGVYTFVIVSSTNTTTIRDFCKREGILDYFEEILGYDVSKSKVAKFKMIQKRYKKYPNQISFITDTVGDIEEALAFGIGDLYAISHISYQSKEVLELAINRVRYARAKNHEFLNTIRFNHLEDLARALVHGWDFHPMDYK